jgi:hypothetical protein
VTVTGVRATIATALAGVVPPGTTVRAYPLALDAVEAPLVMVGIVGIDPPGTACPADAVDVEVLLVAPTREPGTADDHLDALFDLATPALDALPSVTRGTAERVTYLDTWPAYRIPLEYST